MSLFEESEIKAVGSESSDEPTDSGSPLSPESATPISELADPTHAAYARYLSPEGDGLEQGRLVSARRPIPDDAVAVSTGVYFLTPGQEDRLHNGCPARVSQNECNADERVVYSVLAESDAIENGVEVSTITGWLSTFAEEYLDIDEYTLYYSGNRSVHLHTSRFIIPGQLNELKALSEEFNEERDADLDTSIYKPNSQFRLIGARHGNTGLSKVRINEEASIETCIRESQSPPDEIDWPYDLPTPSHHDSYPAFNPNSSPSNIPASHYRPGNQGRSPIPGEFEDQVLTGVNKGDLLSSDETGGSKSDYATPFSPYKKTGGGSGRSVIVMRQDGGLRQDLHSREIRVPASIKYAVGGGDGLFTRENSKSLVRLSPRDYRKWDFQTGDHLVIIGGNSGSSRIFQVETTTWVLVAVTLESKGRQKALDFLSECGYDTGDSGYNPSQYHDDGETEGESKAARIKREIEEGIRRKSYDDIFRVACRLLKIEGWDAAWEWCRNEFGKEFNPEVTHKNLKRIVETYDDYSHVQSPEE